MGEAMRPAKLHALGKWIYDWSFLPTQLPQKRKPYLD